MISRRSLFGFLAAAPIGAAAAVKAAAEPTSAVRLTPGFKYVDPPPIAVGDPIEGGVNLYTSGITWVDPDYDERTGELMRPIAAIRDGKGNIIGWD